MKKIPYGLQSIDRRDIREVVKVLKSDRLTQGPAVRKFEEALCRSTGAKYAVAVANGTAALHLAALAAGIKDGDEAITSPITFAASANCVLYAGGRVVFADIEEKTQNIDAYEVEKKITAKTRAVIPIDYAGHTCDLEKLSQLARQHNLIVIEDACHAIGGEYKVGNRWYKVGSCSHSDMATLSFHPVKTITTAEGGAVLTNRKDLYEKLSLLRTHGITKDVSCFQTPSPGEPGEQGEWYYEMHELGFNYRLSDMQAALGISQLKKLNRFIKRRTQIAQKYQKAFAGNPYFDIPVSLDDETVKSGWHLYPIRLKDKARRRNIFDWLRQEGIGVQVHYIPVYWQPYYQRLGFSKGLCPKAEDFYEREISLPMFPAMSAADVKRVIKIVLESFKR